MERRLFVDSLLLLPLYALLASPSSAVAKTNKDADDSDAEGLLSASDVAERLRNVPTFTIVDKRGVPFMVFGEDAHVTAYFFTAYEEAERILSVAKKSSDRAIAEARKELRAKKKRAGNDKMDIKSEEEDIGTNPWKEARISSVTLDFAVTLASKSSRSGGVYFQIAPSQGDVEDAVAVDTGGKTDLAENKVPLFYFEDMEVPASAVLPSAGSRERLGGEKQVTPLFFRKAELLRAWKDQFPDQAVPNVKVTELFAVLTEMVKPGGTDQDLKRLVFVPPVGSSVKAKECLKKGGKENAFRIGERIVVL